MATQASFLLHAGERHALGGSRGKTLAAFKPLSQPAKLGTIGAKGRIGSGESGLDVGYSSLSPSENLEPEVVLVHQSPDAPQVQVSGVEAPGGSDFGGGTGAGGGSSDGGTDGGGGGGGDGDGGAGSGSGDSSGAPGSGF